MAVLKAEAKRFFDMGLAVVPIKLTFDEEKQKWSKKPLVEWSR